MLAGRKGGLLGLDIAYLPTVWLSRTSLLNNLGYTRKLSFSGGGMQWVTKKEYLWGPMLYQLQNSLRKTYKPDTVLGLEIYSLI